MINTPKGFNKTSNMETRNNISGQGHTCNQPSEVAYDLNSHDSKRISRAESVKNSRRHYKRKNTIGLNNKNTILSSYLPLKNYMVKDMNLVKPVRQMQREKQNTSKTAVSDRN